MFENWFTTACSLLFIIHLENEIETIYLLVYTEYSTLLELQKKMQVQETHSVQWSTLREFLSSRNLEDTYESLHWRKVFNSQENYFAIGHCTTLRKVGRARWRGEQKSQSRKMLKSNLSTLGRNHPMDYPPVSLKSALAVACQLSVDPLAIKVSNWLGDLGIWTGTSGLTPKVDVMLPACMWVSEKVRFGILRLSRLLYSILCDLHRAL